LSESARSAAPGWLAATVRYCSRCGAELTFGSVAGEERPRLSCPSCAFVAYINPRLVVTALPITADGDVYLLRRGIEPAYGRWAQPGGFLEIDETATEGAVRETLEETGLIVEPRRLLGLYSRPQAAIVVAVWEAPVIGGLPTATPESLEVKLFSPRTIPWPQLAFQTTTWALADWVAQQGVEPAGAGPPTAGGGRGRFPDESA
jgi:ADP-ribose pyrophosphatase YjhB (NUDIX family)